MRIRLHRNEGCFFNIKHYIDWCEEALTDFWNIPGEVQTLWVVFTARPVAQSYRVTSILGGLGILYLSGHKQLYDYRATKMVNRFIAKHGKCYVSVEYEV